MKQEALLSMRRGVPLRRWANASAPASGIRFYRFLRNCAYAMLEPADYLVRAQQGKAHMPPLRLRRYVGAWAVRDFESLGQEFTAHLKTLAGLRPDKRVLDIGCGCGSMALQLLDYFDSNGGYVGVDIHKPSIDWCHRNIGARHPGFQFQHLDLRNDLYWAAGKGSPASFVFPFAEESFDVVILKSVFTHLRPPEVENYLKEIGRLLSRGGRCLATFFLSDEAGVEQLESKEARFRFRFGNATWRYETKQCPERAVAYSEAYLASVLSQCGLVAEAVHYGFWSGRPDGLSFQDIMILHKG